MSKTKPLKALKQATQNRSRVTYQAILDACAHILKHQADRLTTNEIAKLAGVSIGSLYQYFPNKEAILAELIESEFILDINLLRKMVKENTGSTIITIFKEYLNTASKIAHREFKLKQILNARLNELDKTQQAMKLQIEFIEDLSILFSSASDWPVNKDAKLIAHICFTMSANTFWMANQLHQNNHKEIEKELLQMFLNNIEIKC